MNANPEDVLGRVKRDLPSLVAELGSCLIPDPRLPAAISAPLLHVRSTPSCKSTTAASNSKPLSRSWLFLILTSILVLSNQFFGSFEACFQRNYDLEAVLGDLPQYHFLFASFDNLFRHTEKALDQYFLKVLDQPAIFGNLLRADFLHFFVEYDLSFLEQIGERLPDVTLLEPRPPA